MSSVSEHGEGSAQRPRLSRIKDPHHLSRKIKHNKSSAAEDCPLILAMIESISTSKHEKGFLQLSLDAGRRLGASPSVPAGQLGDVCGCFQPGKGQRLFVIG